jgi:hypothetical protein
MTVRKTLLLAGAVLCLGLLPLPAAAEEGAKVQAPSADGVRGKTWKTVDELSPEEKATIDLRADTPRDSQIYYLPAEKFPFAAPYTAEEMGLRATEFPHSPFWNCTLFSWFRHCGRRVLSEGHFRSAPAALAECPSSFKGRG